VETLRVDRQLTNLNERIAQAVAYYWRAHQQQSEKQIEQGRSDQGSRSSVTGGYQMSGFSELITALLVDAGVAHEHIFSRQSLELPGFFRSTKEWDLLNKTTLNGKCWAFKDDGREDIFVARRAAESLV